MISLNRPLASFDIESTGVDVQKDRIVELAIVIITPDGKRSARCRRLNPGMPIPPVATAVHGISDDDVQGCPSFSSVAASLAALLKPCDLTGYNIKAFDVPLLAAEFARCGISWPADDVVIVDSYDIFRAREPHTLASALLYYMGRRLDDAHSAEADANAALDVLIGQATDYKPPDEGLTWTLEDLARLQRRDEWVDETGKAKQIGDIVVINFGKWQGTPIDEVDRDYLQWIIGQDFPDDFKTICRDSLAARGGTG